MIETKDAPTQLFREKLRLADGLNCRDLLADLEAADQQLGRLIHEQAELAGVVTAAKGAVLDAETMAGLSVEGKNDVERKANRALALQRDPGYQAAVVALRRAENALAVHEADLEVAKRTARRIERTVEYRTSVLRFLGG